MPINLKVTCHGLIALVPSTDDKHLTAFLPESTPEVIPGQTTFVRFPSANYSASNTRTAISRNGSELAHVMLDRERLTIVADVAPADRQLTIDRSQDAISSTPTSGDAHSFRWLPKVEDLAPGHGDLNPGYFDDILNVTPRLIARFDFTQGRLATTGVEKVQVPFRSSTEARKKPMAREIALHLTIDGNSFTLRSEPFEGTYDPANDLVFEGEGDIEIVLGNEPAADMYEETPPIEPIDVIEKAAAAEFVFYCSLCASVPTDPLLPHVASRPGRYTFCSMGQYNPTDRVKTFSSSNRLRSFGLDADTKEEQPPPPWSVLAFIAVDNSLRNAGPKDLAEMATADPSKVSVVAHLDVAERPTQRLALGPNGFQPISEQPSQNLNSGDPRVVTGFLTFAQKVRPAEHTAVFFLSHATGLLDFTYQRRGNGRPSARDVFFELAGRFPDIALRNASNSIHYYSVLFDDPARDTLDNQELESSLRNALANGDRFDIIGMDACLMGLVEIAYQIRRSGRYFVASQEDIEPDGWPYVGVMAALASNPSPRDAAIAIVDAYAAGATRPDATLSAVDLDAVADVAVALDQLGGMLLPLVATNLDALARAREDARVFTHYDYIDLSGFVQALPVRFGKVLDAKALGLLSSAADAVLKQLAAAVIKTSHQPRVSHAGGLSVYLPNAPVAPEYHKLLMSKDAPGWHEFVVAYGDHR